MYDPTRPDLEDSTNVTEAHERLLREAAAAAREKRLHETGNEPLSLGLFTVCGVVMLVAGAVLGKAGNFFSYHDTVRPGYVRDLPEGVSLKGPEPMPAIDAYARRGQKIYSAKCNGCHGPDAKGDGANYPSLVGSPWANGETERFAMIILNGLTGPSSSGKTYGAGMTPQGPLSPEELAGVMTYVRNNFGNTKGDVISVEQAKAALEVSDKRAKRGLQTTKEELETEHLKDLPGDKLDPATKVDPISLLPVKSGTPAVAPAGT
jgi:mono/diheme cytochrome c family protein